MDPRTACLIVLGGILLTPSTDAGDGDAARKALDAEAVAKLPYPGTATPSAIAFTPAGKALTYLKPERPDSLSRVLWRVELPDGEPRVVARPPGEGTTETNVSPEEALRRERLRQRDTGITQVIRAAGADVAVIPLGGDLYLQRGAGPLERLTETPSPEIDPKLNADGSKVAFVRNSELHVLDIGTKREVQLTHGATEGVTHGLAEYIAQEELDRGSGFWWSPDGSQIAYQETDERHIPLFTITHQGDDPKALETHRYPFAGAANARVRLGIVPVAGGKTRWLPILGPDEDAYLARVEWDGPKRLLVQVLTRDQKRLTLERIDIDSHERTLLIEERSDTWINLHDDLRIVEGTGEILWSSERGGVRELELYDRDGNLIRVLDGPRGIDGVIALDSKRREAWYTTSDGKPTDRFVFRASLDGGPPIPWSHEAGTAQAVVAPDFEHVVVTHSSLTTPPRTVLRAREEGDEKGRVLDDTGADARRHELDITPPDARYTFPNRDGVLLHGAYYGPKNQALGARAPLIVMVYGGPHVQQVADSWSLTADLQAQYLAARGFAVWKCDNRGSSRRGKVFEAAINRRMGTVEVEDQVAGVRHLLAARPEIDPNRVGITGGSYGGYMTLRCLELAPDVFKAGVAIAPVTDWDGYDTAYTERYMGTPKDNPEGYRDSSVLTHADRITGKLMVIHGLIDENVHFRHTARLATAMTAANRPFDLIILPESRHATRKVEDIRYIAERRARFFEAALGPNAAR